MFGACVFQVFKPISFFIVPCTDIDAVLLICQTGLLYVFFVRPSGASMKVFGVLGQLSVLVNVEQGDDNERGCKPDCRYQSRVQKGLPDERIRRSAEMEYPDKPLIRRIDFDGRHLEERRSQGRLVVKMRRNVLRGDDVGREDEKQAEQG
jgi:hypothetical protein